MRLLEHQAKRLLAGFGLEFTHGTLVESAEAARASAESLGGPVMIKAQLPFGGRGLLGAVRRADNGDAGFEAARELLAMEVGGARVSQIVVEPMIEVQREYYLGVTWDTALKRPVALLSRDGGVDVEASKRVIRRTFDPWHGLEAHAGRVMALEAGVRGPNMVAVGAMASRLSHAFLALDALTVEINPLAETADGRLIGLDARVEIDDDAHFRQEWRLAPLGTIADLQATGRRATPRETEARRIDGMDHRGVAGRLVEFDGDLGLLIGGGGASLTVFDAIRRHGGRPANYCEVGGNPTEEKVAALVALVLSRPDVRHLAVIMNVVNNTRADVMARGVTAGVRRAGRIPAETISVFRIPGSWEEEARELLAAEGVVALGREVSLDEAARLAVERSRRAC